MNLRKQLLLVSLLMLVLPWAGCQFIRETESALRDGQQQMLAGTAQAIADSLSQLSDQFASAPDDGRYGENQLYGHPLATAPLVDGYLDDWSIEEDSLQSMRGTDGAIRYAAGVAGNNVYLYVEVRDNAVVYDQMAPGGSMQPYSDHVTLVSADSSGNTESFLFRPEAPGRIVPNRGADDRPETRIAAHWQDTADGYQLEARLPLAIVDERLGVVVVNTGNAGTRGVSSASFAGEVPGRFVTSSPLIGSVITGYVQPGMRLIVTDRIGWRLADAGEIAGGGTGAAPSGWMLRAMGLLLQPGAEELLAEPHPTGREQQGYVASALNARADWSWFRSERTGRAVVAVAQPIWSGNAQIGAVILQQGTDAILSLANESLTRLIGLTLVATLGAALGLIAYATWLSLRVRRLSSAAEQALEGDHVRVELPSATAGDEIGDLSRSFADVLTQIGEYNEYLRTLASKLSHELRTPLTIVTSSLENLEHEGLSGEAATYAARARDGAARLRKILNAMSEANRVEELIERAEPERFDLCAVLETTVAAYGGAWPERKFAFETSPDRAEMIGSPELIVQMLDKLTDNAVDFTREGGTFTIGLESQDDRLRLSVHNPGPPLPDKMRSQLFDSMVSFRETGEEHLGLGLYIVRLIAEGHGGSVEADNVGDGVTFTVTLPLLGTDPN